MKDKGDLLSGKNQGKADFPMADAEFFLYDRYIHFP
jgi:hypothetical protein